MILSRSGLETIAGVDHVHLYRQGMVNRFVSTSTSLQVKGNFSQDANIVWQKESKQEKQVARDDGLNPEHAGCRWTYNAVSICLNVSSA
jgi:hypothetical protein